MNASNGTIQGSAPIGNTLVGNPIPLAAVDSLGKVRALTINDDGELKVTGGSSSGGVVTQPDASLLNTTAVQGGTWNVGLSAGANAIGSVTVTSLPSIPAGANAIGSVTVSNFPATQPVSGTVAATQSGAWTNTVTQATGTNLHTVVDSGTVAATQSGSWAVTVAAGSAVIGHVITDTGSTTAVTGNVTAVQPTGTNLHTVVDSGTVTANIGTTNGLALDASVTALQVAQASTTSGQVGNLVQGATTTAAPSYTTAKTNPLSLTTTGDLRVALASLPALATGSNTIGAVTLTDGTTVANTLNTGTSGQNALLVTGASNVVSFTTSSVQAVATTDCLNMRGVCVQVTSQGTTSTVTFQQSNDQATWINVPAVVASTGATASVVTSTTTLNLYRMNVTGRYFRLNVTGISAGTTAGIVAFYANPFPELMQTVQAAQQGTWTVQQGSTPSATPWAVNPVAAATGGYSFSNITTATTTTSKSGAGFLHTIVVNTGGTGSTLTVYDNTAGSGTKIATIDTATIGSKVFDLAFATGLTFVSASGTPADITATWK